MGKPRGSRKDKVEKKGDSDSEDELDSVVLDEEEQLTSGQGQTSKLTSSKSQRKVIVAHKGIADIGWDNIEQIMLPHPKTLTKSAFLLDTRTDVKKDVTSDLKNHVLFEILTMEEETGSWFIDNSVVTDGNIYVCTPFDPLFLILPTLIKHSHQAKPLRDHLTEFISNHVAVQALFSHLTNRNAKQMENISTKIVCDDIIAYKYSEERTLTWLSTKAERTSKLLAEKDISSSEASVSSNFTKPCSDADKKQEEYLIYACDIVGEYLEDELKKKLFLKLGLPIQEKGSTKRKNDAELDHNDKKKVKVTNSNSTGPSEDYGSSTPTTNTSASVQNSRTKAKEKEFQKAAKGTQSLFKFFAPKSK